MPFAGVGGGLVLRIVSVVLLGGLGTPPSAAASTVDARVLQYWGRSGTLCPCVRLPLNVSSWRSTSNRWPRSKH